LKEHNDGDFMGMVVLDSQANVVWYYESSNGEVRAIGQKSNGNLIYVANLSGLREITPLGEEVNRLDETCMTSEAQGQIHHEVQQVHHTDRNQLLETLPAMSPHPLQWKMNRHFPMYIYHP